MIMFSRFVMVHECEEQTDKRTDVQNSDSIIIPRDRRDVIASKR